MSRYNIAQPKALTVRDVSSHDFVTEYARHLKKGGKIEVPKFVEYAKTANFKEHGPQNEDWYFVRCASIARKIYLRPGTGIGALTKVYGGLARRGTLTNKYQIASPGVIRHCLHSLESLGVLEHHPKGGRRVTVDGQRDLDSIASVMESDDE